MRPLPRARQRIRGGLAAESFLAPGSALDTAELVADMLATDGTARTGLGASAGAGRFADETAVVAALRWPIAIVDGADEQLVSLDYLRQLTIPALWRGEVQVLAQHGAPLRRSTAGGLAVPHRQHPAPPEPRRLGVRAQVRQIQPGHARGSNQEMTIVLSDRLLSLEPTG